MPIIGLTDRPPQFPKIGDIRKGAPKTDKRIGKDLDYFRAVFPEDERDAAAAFLEAYGPEPREINIVLPFPEIERNWEAWNEEHTTGALQHRCDSVTCVLWRDTAGTMQHSPKPCPGGCKQVGRLTVIVPELGRLAYMQVHTTSKWDIVEISKNLESLRRMNNGTIRFVPLVLKRRPRTVSTPRPGGKQARREMWLLSIEARPSWVEAKLMELRMHTLPQEYVALPSRASSSDLAIEADFPENEEPAAWDGEVFNAAAGDAPPPEPAPEPEPEVREILIDGNGIPWEQQAPEPQPAAAISDEPGTLSLPIHWPSFAKLAQEKLGYTSVNEVRDALIAAGITRICSPEGVVKFIPLDGWTILADNAPGPVQATLPV